MLAHATYSQLTLLLLRISPMLSHTLSRKTRHQIQATTSQVHILLCVIIKINEQI